MTWRVNNPLGRQMKDRIEYSFYKKEGIHNIFKSRRGGWLVSFTDWQVAHEKAELEHQWGIFEWPK